MVNLSPVWAVDFDNTLAWTSYPTILEPRNDVIEKIKDAQSKGIKIILWTCREDDDLKNAIAFCEEHGLVFDAVNKNVSERISFFNNDCRKVWADLYIDDKSTLPETI